ncbi:uncharacterized protein LOC115230974 [Octopus sinensis]|uniref:Uncharacterized protein LOC115230974 n=1 Tax=Octopus sinensis TaxID=2607531 RepID=A0A6P7U3T4_9MOLL|nr:uncharacterized protein LOC115230974 [Octopus sinensis]
MVVGDLNAKHIELGFRVTNAHGLALKTLVEDLGLEIRTSSEPNHIDSRGGLDWLGLALVSPGMLNWVSKTILLPDIGSDHLPLLHELREPVSQRVPGYFDLRSGSWANLERFMASRLPSLLVGNTCANIRELEALDNGINAALTDYMRDNFKQNSVQGKSHSTLPYRVLNKIKFKRRLSRLRDKCVYEENRVWFRGWISRLQREIKREIRELESSRWERACRRVDARFPDFWKQLKSLSGRGVANSVRLKRSDGTLVSDPVEVAEIFSTHLDNISGTDGSQFVETSSFDTVQQILSWDKRCQLGISRNDAGDISEAEILAAISRSKNTAAGLDRIPMALFKKAPPLLITALQVLFSGSLRLGMIPSR